MPVLQRARPLIALAFIAPLCACVCACGGAASVSNAAAPSIASSSSGGSGSDEPRAPAAMRRERFAGESAGASMAAHGLPATTVAPHATEGPSPLESPAESAAATAQMLVYTGNVALAVDNVPHAIEQVIEVAVSSGGFLAARADESVQVRVPSSHFRAVMDSVEHLGDVTHHDVQAEDVSETFHDLEVQLANLRAVRARLQEFLGRAANVQEALAVERELERVSGQIDQIEGRLRFLADRVSLSTLNITLTRHATAASDLGPAAPDANAPLPFVWLDRAGLPNLLRLH